MKISLILVMLWLILLGTLLNWLAWGADWLDGRLYYSSWEALGYLSTLDPALIKRLTAFALIDLFLFLPSYFYFGLRLSKTLLHNRLWPMFFLCIGASADLIETSFGLIALQGKGWESGFVPMVLSLSTPVKWAGLILALLCYLLLVARSKFLKAAS